MAIYPLALSSENLPPTDDQVAHLLSAFIYYPQDHIFQALTAVGTKWLVSVALSKIPREGTMITALVWARNASQQWVWQMDSRMQIDSRKNPGTSQPCKFVSKSMYSRFLAYPP